MSLDILPARTTLQLSLLSTCHFRVAQPKRCFALRTVSTIQTSPFLTVELLSLSLRSRQNGLEYRFLLKDNSSTKGGVRRRHNRWVEMAKRTQDNSLIMLSSQDLTNRILISNHQLNISNQHRTVLLPRISSIKFNSRILSSLSKLQVKLQNEVNQMQLQISAITSPLRQKLTPHQSNRNQFKTPHRTKEA